MKNNRKAITTFLIIVISMPWSISAQYKYDQRELGELAVELMQELGENSKAEHLDKFISKEFMETLYEHTNEDGKNNRVLKKFNELSEQEFNSGLTEMYNGLREDAATKGIVWEDIEFIDLINDDGPVFFGRIDTHYITRDWIQGHYNDAIYGVGGWLYWKYNNKVYKSELGALFVDNDFWLIKLEDAYLQD
jgi:hypothetical protein